MFDRFTDQTRAALVSAHAIATGLGHDTVDSADLVLAFLATGDTVAARALTGLGISDAALRRHVGGVEVRLAAGRSDGRAPLTGESTFVLRAAQREANALGHANLTSGHVLLGAVATPGSAAAVALSALGVDATTIRAAVRRVHDLGGCDERPTDRELASAALARVPFDPAPPLPGTGSLLAWVLLTLTWYATTVGALVAWRWRAADPATLAVMLAGIPAGMAVIGVSVGGARLGHRFARAAPDRVPVPDRLATIASGRGITSLEIRIDAGRRGRDRCSRARGRAWVLLSPYTVRSQSRLRFVLGHELGHVLRHDRLRRVVGTALYLGLLGTAVASADPVAVAVALVSTAAHQVASYWWSELSCDALAARWFGADAVHAWEAYLRAMPLFPVDRTARGRMVNLAARFTHPPVTLRLARLR